MGKAKKQLTNERRARRLGTGAGIARVERRQGIPGWAWLVAGSVLLAAAIIGAAIAFRGGGGGGGSGGQSSAVVQDRLSHAKLDFVSMPTWPPNYTDLQGALGALGLSSGAMDQSINHYHVHIRIFVDGHNVPIPSQVGIDPTGPFSEIHTHDDSGIIHIESTSQSFRGTLIELFDVWGVYFSPQCIGGDCGGVKMWVNGKPSTQYGSLVLQDHMLVDLVDGTPPKNFKPQSSFDWQKLGL